MTNPAPLSRLVRKSFSIGESMRNVASFVIIHRRVIGVIIGSALVLFGEPDIGNQILNVLEN